MKRLPFQQYLPLAVGLILMVFAYFKYKGSLDIDKEESADHIEQTVDEKFERSSELLDQFSFNYLKKGSFEKLHESFDEVYEDEGIYLAAYVNGEIAYWSNNIVPAPILDTTLSKAERIVRLNDGWYLVSRAEQEPNMVAYALALVKTTYQYENKYLESGFHSDFDFPYRVSITTDESESGIVIKHKKKFLFTIKLGPDAMDDHPQRNAILALVFTLGFLIVMVFLYKGAIEISKQRHWSVGLLVFILPLVLFRFWTLKDGAPSVLYDLELFDPKLYAQSSILPSLGDLLFNCLVLFLIMYFGYRVLKQRDNIRVKFTALHIGLVLVGLLALFYGSHKVNQLLMGMVFNSQINFEISNLFDLNVYSFVGILAIGLIFFTYFIVCCIVILFVRKSDFRLNHYYFALTVCAAAHVIVGSIVTDYDLLQVLWPVFVILITGFILLGQRLGFTFAPVVSLLMINALVAAHVILKYTEEKELSDRLQYLEHRLAYDEDWNIEYAFKDMEDDLTNSDILKWPFSHGDEFDKPYFDHVLETEFFDGDWDQYDISFNLFASDSTPIAQRAGSPLYFEPLMDIKTRSGIPSEHSPNIYQIPNFDNNLSYLIHLVVPGEGEPLGHLFCVLKSKKFPKDIGFPELLIDKNATLEELAGYSFARYLDSSLVLKIGPYNYSIFDHHIEEKLDTNDHAVFDENGYNHMVYRVGPNSLLVLGKPQTTFLEKATSFSYLFALFAILVLLSVMVKEIRRFNDLSRLSLKNKIQLVVIGLILACLILFGLGTRFFIERQYNEKNNKLISEKIKSVNIEVKKKLGGTEDLKANLNFANSMLDKFSQVFFTDISLYDTTGTLLATSRFEIFYSGLLGKKMHPRAFIELSKKERSEFIQQEYVGEMNYLSAYVPFINDNGQIVGYLNLPYFAKQNPLENEISKFLVAIINIFVVLFALSIVAALFVSNWVTKPLKLLQSSVSNIELGKTNEPIQYTGQDEIGDLVQEYNKKVTELENAVDQLARSERESAWRDMAKQVAHEIKNPLTPMKLSVQHFQRSFDKDSPDASDRIERFSQTLIEQIETLTSIANEFSNFAKMPTAQVEEVNLADILSSTVSLFNEGDEAEITLMNNVTGDRIVKHDREHLVRVFNNLIKNATQAIPHDREGVIEVILSEKEDTFLVEVKDNGTGIPDDKLDKIFVPNFTTKSKGMGLGLSMVNNIVQNAGGRVWFETVEGEGTSFYVELPAKDPI